MGSYMTKGELCYTSLDYQNALEMYNNEIHKNPKSHLALLLKGNSGESYNVSNKNTAISIKEMAELVCNIFLESEITVKTEIPEDISIYGYNPEAIVKLDSTKIESLGWHPTTDLENMFINTVKSMREKKEKNSKPKM